jgi:hypothetical protein
MTDSPKPKSSFSRFMSGATLVIISNGLTIFMLRYTNLFAPASWPAQQPDVIVPETQIEPIENKEPEPLLEYFPNPEPKPEPPPEPAPEPPKKPKARKKPRKETLEPLPIIQAQTIQHDPLPEPAPLEDTDPTLPKNMPTEAQRAATRLILSRPKSSEKYDEIRTITKTFTYGGTQQNKQDADKGKNRQPADGPRQTHEPDYPAPPPEAPAERQREQDPALDRPRQQPNYDALKTAYPVLALRDPEPALRGREDDHRGGDFWGHPTEDVAKQTEAPTEPDTSDTEPIAEAQRIIPNYDALRTTAPPLYFINPMPMLRGREDDFTSDEPRRMPRQETKEPIEAALPPNVFNAEYRRADKADGEPDEPDWNTIKTIAPPIISFLALPTATHHEAITIESPAEYTSRDIATAVALARAINENLSAPEPEEADAAAEYTRRDIGAALIAADVSAASLPDYTKTDIDSAYVSASIAPADQSGPKITENAADSGPVEYTAQDIEPSSPRIVTWRSRLMPPARFQRAAYVPPALPELPTCATAIQAPEPQPTASEDMSALLTEIKKDMGMQPRNPHEALTMDWEDYLTATERMMIRAFVPTIRETEPWRVSTQNGSSLVMAATQSHPTAGSMTAALTAADKITPPQIQVTAAEPRPRQAEPKPAQAAPELEKSDFDGLTIPHQMPLEKGLIIQSRSNIPNTPPLALVPQMPKPTKAAKPPAAEGKITNLAYALTSAAPQAAPASMPPTQLVQPKEKLYKYSPLTLAGNDRKIGSGHVAVEISSVVGRLFNQYAHENKYMWKVYSVRNNPNFASEADALADISISGENTLAPRLAFKTPNRWPGGSAVILSLTINNKGSYWSGSYLLNSNPM